MRLKVVTALEEEEEEGAVAVVAEEDAVVVVDMAGLNAREMIVVTSLSPMAERLNIIHRFVSPRKCLIK